MADPGATISVVFAQVSSIHGDAQLELAIGWYVELATSLVGFPAVAARQLDGQGAGDHVHDLALAGAEFVFAGSHDADGGGALIQAESDGLDGAVEILVDFEHGKASLR